MAKKKAPPAGPKPKVFIGSSVEGQRIAQAIGANLEYVAEPYIWTHIFELSKTTVETLEKTAEECQFAIFVFTADDEVNFRGAKLKAARDNVLWEHGLFSGKLARDRTFIVMPRDVKGLKLPTDQLGVTTATYDSSRLGGNPQSALGTACFHITQAIEAAIKATAPTLPAVATAAPPAGPPTAPPGGLTDQSALWARASKHVADLLGLLGGGTAGLAIINNDANKLKRWTDNLLNMVLDVFKAKQDDVYVAWLRPNNSKPPELVCYASEGAVDPHKHHGFAAGEGLVGNVWSQRKAAGHSPGRPHEWWKLRKGCENNAYLSAPVGDFAGSGGVLGVGSDKGFEISEDDVAILEMFASLLGFVAHLMPMAASSPGTVPMKGARSRGSRNRPGA